MRSFLQIVKQAAVEGVQASYPADVMFGKVENVSPTQIRLSEKLVIDDDFLIKTESAVDRLNEGDTVLLLRVQGGQRYVFLDRVVNE